MRKSTLFFLSGILILGGVVFFIGWVQFAVPPGAYGVMRSKTGGVDAVTLRNGEFRWAWERLLPTNAVVITFVPKTVEKNLEVSGTLPSADLYAELIGAAGDFSYEIQGTFSFSVKGDALPRMAANMNILDQDALDAWQRVAAEDMAAFAVRRLRAYAEDSADAELLLGPSVHPRLLADMERAFPEVTLHSFSLRRIRFPDLALYGAAKALYQEYLAGQRVLWTTEAAEAGEKNVALRKRLDELSRYGELLTKYPALLDYLAIEAGKR